MRPTRRPTNRMDDLNEPEALSHDPQHRGPRQMRQWVVEPDQAGQRIDLFLALQCDGYSRVFLRKVLHEGSVWLDGKPVKPSFKVQTGQTVKIDLP
ncbi:MAG: S4 domain-containing protein, partial [bacterium]